jgi:carbon-monoxide dehydrogenase large subunit
VVEDRSEAFVATTHGRDIIGYVDLAAKRDGKVLGLKLRLIADIGAYNMLLTAAIPTLTMLMASAPTTFRRSVPRSRGLHQQDADRRLSRRRPSGGNLFPRTGDGHAGARAEYGSSRCAPQNFIQPKQFPFATQMGAVYDSGDYEQALDLR